MRCQLGLVQPRRSAGGRRVKDQGCRPHAVYRPEQAVAAERSRGAGLRPLRAAGRPSGARLLPGHGAGAHKGAGRWRR